MSKENLSLSLSLFRKVALSKQQKKKKKLFVGKCHLPSSFSFQKIPKKVNVEKVVYNSRD